MNNPIYDSEIKEIKSQLDKAEVQKNKLVNIINTEYESYLKLVRSLMLPAAENGLHRLFAYLSTKNIVTNPNEVINFFENKILNIINSKLPLITIEQLKISEIDNNSKEVFNVEENLTFRELDKYKLSGIDTEDYLISDEPTHFEDDRNMYKINEYYNLSKEDNILSIDLDNSENFYYYPNQKSIEKNGLNDYFVSTSHELIEKDNIDESSIIENFNNHENEISNQIQNFDLIEKSLNNLLLNLSYKINLELFNSKLISTIISEDTFKYLSNKQFMVKHQNPFIIKYDFDQIQSLRNKAKLPVFPLLNISRIELEFEYLNLSIQRIKINKLKNKFQLLIKKERYWKQKQINLNKINRK